MWRQPAPVSRLCLCTCSWLLGWVVLYLSAGNPALATETHFVQAQNSSSEKCSHSVNLHGAWIGGRQSLGTQLPFTSQVQALLWKHQHPPDCDASAFLVYSAGSGLGIGAKLDFLAAALGRALDQGRVLILDYGDDWVEGSFCQGFPTMDTCFFEPVSSCGLKDVYGQGFVSNPAFYRNATRIQEAHHRLTSLRIHFEQGHTFTNSVPLQLGSILSRAAIQLDAIVGGVRADCYWWRSHGVSYVARPNHRTLKELADVRLRAFGQDIKRGTVSIHVRHGDKHKDHVPPVSNNIYWALAEDLIQTFPGELQSKYFLSTEDPDTVEYFKKTAGPSVQYVQVQRNNHAGGSPMNVPDASREMIFALLNLDLALECDAWVCTLTSMWCTLIDRLRATVRCKASGYYRDAHHTLEGLAHSWEVLTTKSIL